jgi:SWI/SNF-related matrix-associated actin-dependent regulator 1 of chromatin subfamily A
MTHSVDEALNAQADAFARLLALSPGDPDQAFRRAAALAAGLFPHQIEGVAFLLGRRRAILADDMGLGKTRQAIVALRHAAPKGPYLVVCPASVRQNWVREVSFAVPTASTYIVRNEARAPEGHDWVVINYDILARHVGVLERLPWAGIVFDEAHYLKNHRSARSRIARQLADEAKRRVDPEPAVYLLTGTPLTNRPRDLFVLLQLVGHPLGRSFLSFAKRYCAAERNDFGWQTGGASNIEELTVQLHGVMLRRAKGQVLALPPKLRTWLPVEVPKGTGVRDMRKAVELLASHQRVAPRSDISEWSLRGRLLQAVTRARQKVAEAKVAATIEFTTGAIEQGEKVIVFSCFAETMRQLAKHFGDAAVVVTGQTPADARQDLVDRFQHDEGIRVFLANIIAGGVGTNLTAATQVVFNDLDWVPANHWQAEDRAYRIGQSRTVNVTYMVAANTIDDFVQAVLDRKRTLVAAVVDGQALAPGVPGDVLEELQRAVRAMASASEPADIDKDDFIDRLVQRARADMPASLDVRVDRPNVTTEDDQAFRRALQALARALAPPPVERYRFASASHPGVEYEITVDGADVSCTCPGFEYRGQCRHARDVKAAVGAGKAMPGGYAAG